jgi:hypothetical protein
MGCPSPPFPPDTSATLPSRSKSFLLHVGAQLSAHLGSRGPFVTSPTNRQVSVLIKRVLLTSPGRRG